MAEEHISDSLERQPTLLGITVAVATLTERIAGLRSQSESVERKLDSTLSLYATKEEVKQETKPLAERISKLENGISWIVRLVIGIVIAALLGLVLVAKH